MSNSECKRCGGGAVIARYSHVAQGACFACGKRPEAAPVAAMTRAEHIRGIRLLLDAAAERVGALGEWLDGEDGPMRGTVEQSIDAAPDDVATRARAAFAKLGARLYVAA
jgi:hypothetical protein